MISVDIFSEDGYQGEEKSLDGEHEDEAGCRRRGVLLVIINNAHHSLHHMRGEGLCSIVCLNVI